jgi:hypothetical protein
MAALQSGGRLLAPIEQETALAWAGFVLLTLDAIGVQQHAEVCGQLQPLCRLDFATPRTNKQVNFCAWQYPSVACISGALHCSSHAMCIAYCSAT